MVCTVCFKEIDESRPEADGVLTNMVIALMKVTPKDGSCYCEECAKEYIREKLRQKYRALLAPLFQELNSTLSDHEGLNSEAFADALCSEHRQLQAYLIEFLYEKVTKVLARRADDDRWVDARNAWSFRYLKKLSEVQV